MGRMRSVASRRPARLGARLMSLCGALLLTGCVLAPGGAGAAPTGSAPDPSAPGSPAPGSSAPDSSAPAGTDPAPGGGTETPSADPAAAPSASAPQAPEPPPYCGDDYVLAFATSGPVAWTGTGTQVLAAAQPTDWFEPYEAIAGFDVHCVASYWMPTDGGPGVVRISEAVLAPGTDLSVLDAWATANEYLPAPGTSGFVERYAPPRADGSTTRKIYWIPLDDDAVGLADAPRIRDLTDAPHGSFFVWHADFTQEYVEQP